MGFKTLPLFSTRLGEPSIYGQKITWDQIAYPAEPKPPAPPPMRPLELVVYDQSFGWVTLGTLPAHDLKTPVDLVVHDDRLGPVTIGRITFGGEPAPYSTTIPITLQTEPLPGRLPDQSPGPPLTPAPTPASAVESQKVAGSVSSGSLLNQLGRDPNPISAAHAAGTEEENRSPRDAAPANPAPGLIQLAAYHTAPADPAGIGAYDLAMERRRAEAADAVRSGQPLPKSVKTGEDGVPPPIDPATLPPGPLSPADYERVHDRAIYLGHLYNRDSLSDRAINLVTGAMDNPANVLTPSQQVEQQALVAKLIETRNAPPSPEVARLMAMLDSPIGAWASVTVGVLGGSQEAQDAALALGGAAESAGMAAAGGRAGRGTEFLGAQTGAGTRPAVPLEPPRAAVTEPPPPKPRPASPEPERNVREPDEPVNSRGTVPAVGPVSPIVPTPRNGVIGGKPTGIPETDPRADREMQLSLAIQRLSGDAMAAAGYTVEWQPAVYPTDGVKLTRRPDMRLGGNIADVYTPRTSRLEGIRDELSRKVRNQQAFHVVLNLSLVEEIRPSDVTDILQRKPIPGLQELFAITSNGAIYRLFPDPEEIAIPNSAQGR